MEKYFILKGDRADLNVVVDRVEERLKGKL